MTVSACLRYGFAVVLLVAAATPGGAAALPADCGWQFIPSARTDRGELHGVSGTSSTDVWAVGGTSSVAPIVEHWDGTRWTRYPQPLALGTLSDVAAITPDQAWAVGNDQLRARAIIEVWDGSSWSIARVPFPEGAGFPAVEALSGHDDWAAGSYLGALFMHWDGQLWKRVPGGEGTVGSGGLIYDLAALSPTDIWAVGYVDAFAGIVPLVQHWDGTSWHVVRAPAPSLGGTNILWAVSGAAPDDVWAVGTTEDSGFIEHWDGDRWTLFRESDSVLVSLEAVASDDVWAVGHRHLEPALIEHWDGQAWTEVPSPEVGLQSTLGAVTAIARDDIWAVGDWFPQDISEGYPLTEHYSGPC